MNDIKRLIYSAGMNVDSDDAYHPRINEEVDSLKNLIRLNRPIIILNHQGDHAASTAKHTPYLAKILSNRLGREVKYVESCIGEQAKSQASRMRGGDIALFGNTRLYSGEQENCVQFARQLAQLGDQIIIGGFSKLHRENASNSAIKSFLPWSYSEGVQKELNYLSQIKSELFERKKIILILGGNKIEKSFFLKDLSHLGHVDKIVVGGLVLNSVLKSLGYCIGRSSYHDITFSIDILSKLFIPQVLIVKTIEGDIKECRREDVSELDEIIDFIFDEVYFSSVKEKPDNYSFFAAGPLSCVDSNLSHHCYQLLKNHSVQGLFMGGDTAKEVQVFSHVSTGGGAALRFFSHGYDSSLK